MDVASTDSPLHLRLVLSPGPTPAARVLLPRRLRQLPPEQQRGAQALEVCPQGMALAESLARRVARHGGAALIVDYGQVRGAWGAGFVLDANTLGLQLFTCLPGRSPVRPIWV